METSVLIGVIALVLAVVFFGLLLYYLFSPRRQINIKSLMVSSASADLINATKSRLRTQGEVSPEDMERVKSLAKQRVKKKPTVTLKERFFHAGIFSEEDIREFNRMRVLFPIFGTILVAGLVGYLAPSFALIGAIVGLLLGLQLPFSILDRRIAYRSEDIMFYLPLVVEQIVIGVSSSLDVGPCVQRVVAMADERDSHNSVTELLRHAQLLVKSGLSLEEALNEIGRLSGHTELKHTFMALSPVAKHGGEITRQLQELADAVASQREARIEGKIKKLELEATGPVGLVFLGFLMILLIGFGNQIMKVFE